MKEIRCDRCGKKVDYIRYSMVIYRIKKVWAWSSFSFEQDLCAVCSVELKKWMENKL